jgi:CheY-like chemotaxis protein
MIEVESHSGAGTLCRITFPKSRAGTSVNNILVVDDEHGIRVLHSRYIKRVLPDANILHASDGAEALQLARNYSLKLILYDNDMPDMDGEEMVRSLKSDPVTADIPVIIVTGQDSDTNREALKVYGATEVLTKPITPEQIAEILKNIDAGEVPISVS